MTIFFYPKFPVPLCLVVLTTFTALPTQIAAQTRCDASVAIGHIKRLELPSGGVALVRASGATLANPTSLTPVCPMDDIRISGAAVAHVEIYGATPVAVRSFSPWRPLRPRANTNMRQNILAMVADKFLPDLGRVETSQRSRGGPLDPTVARVPSVRTGSDILPLGELSGIIRVPVYGELWLSSAQIRGPDGLVRNSRAIEGQDIIFDAAGLTPGRYEIIVSKAPISRLPPPTRTIGAFTLVPGLGPTLAPTGRTFYLPETVTGLRALWLADTHGIQHGLLAYQLATRARMESIPATTVTELVLKTLSPPRPSGTSSQALK
jgi:hypothetical protein